MRNTRGGRWLHSAAVADWSSIRRACARAYAPLDARTRPPIAAPPPVCLVLLGARDDDDGRMLASSRIDIVDDPEELRRKAARVRDLAQSPRRGAQRAHGYLLDLAARLEQDAERLEGIRKARQRMEPIMAGDKPGGITARRRAAIDPGPLIGAPKKPKT